MLYEKFEWDENKNQINIKKHKVSFEEAETVFDDKEAILINDPDYSETNDDRFLILGASKQENLLVVCHCYRVSDTIVRIISARKATINEKKTYYKRR
jgi:uncharacterized DUF497 family protein